MKKVTAEMTNRERCIYDWEILSLNPGMTKDELRDKHKKDGNEDQLCDEQCWACVEAKETSGFNHGFCNHCPVIWTIGQKKYCKSETSAYEKWCNNGRISGSEVLNIIKNTWEESDVIPIEEMQPLQIGRIVSSTSVYNNRIVMRTASSGRFEVMDLTDLDEDNCWTTPFFLKVELFSKEKTEKFFNALSGIIQGL